MTNQENNETKREHLRVPATAPLTDMIRHNIEVGGHHLAVFEKGDGPVVLLVHGIPDSSAIWRYQIPPLLTAGFRVIAPDLLGQGDSDIPFEQKEYTIAKDEERLWGVVDRLGVDSFYLVGHDRGAPATWAMAAHKPERVKRFIAMSAGHNNSFQNAGLEQKQRSWYMLRFQLEDAEDLLRRDNWAFFRWWMRYHPECEVWLKDLERPGALSAMVNYYRANMNPATADWEPLPKVEVPTLGIWPTDDVYLGVEQMARSAEWCTGPWRFISLDGAGHFLQLDRPEVVARLIVDYFTNTTL